MDQNAYSVFACALLVSILFFSSTASAGRALLGTSEKGNGRNKIEVHPSPSKPAHSAVGQVPPSSATPSGAAPAHRPLTASTKNPVQIIPCGAGQSFTGCQTGRAASACRNSTDRRCIKSR